MLTFYMNAPFTNMHMYVTPYMYMYMYMHVGRVRFQTYLAAMYVES